MAEINRLKYLSEQECIRLRNRCRQWSDHDEKYNLRQGPIVWLLVDLALSTGLRVSELAAIRVKDVDFRREGLHVKRLKKESADKVLVVVGRETLQHVKDYLAGRKSGPLFIGKRGPMSYRGLQCLWKSACKKAGLSPDYSIKAARHSVGSHLTRTKGVKYAQLVLGHEKIATTADFYATIPHEDLVDAMSDLFTEKAKQ